MEIEIPEKLQLFVKAFSVESEAAAKILITEAMLVLCGSSGICVSKGVSKEEIEGVYSLMLGIKPKNIFEAIFTAQIIASHLLGLRLLLKNYDEDQALGLHFLSHSNKVLAQLEKRRLADMPMQIISAVKLEE